MNLFWIITLGYIGLCLLLYLFVPCFRCTWKSFNRDIIKESFKGSRKEVDICKKTGINLIIVLILMVLSIIVFLLMPFCIYWINRFYKIEIELQKKEENFKNHSKKIAEFFPEIPVKTEYLRNILIIKLKKDVPFIPDKKQIIYVEREYNEPLNHFISKKYENIVEAFKSFGENYDFIYMPLYLKKLTERGIEMLKYSYPCLNDTEILLHKEVVARYIIDNILSYSDTPVSITGGGLMRYSETKDNYHIFKCFQFRNFEENEILEQFRVYLKGISNAFQNVLYSLKKEIISEDEADRRFSYAAQNLINEIRERVELLKLNGISELVIKSLFKFDDAVKLSRLKITKDYRIFLPDYHNLEITMTPLPKAVYFLFLMHPEGILFKHLPDYRDELMNIYKHISNREMLRDMEKSIDDVTSPTKNAINEKCSRIREAFIRHFDESVAKNYFITGLRSEPKKIALDRQLVTWESKW